MTKNAVRCLCIGMLLLSFLGGRQARAGERDRFSVQRTDHQLHMLATYGLSLSLTELLQSRKVSRFQSVLYSSLSIMAFALAKEAFHDSEFQQGDMVANGIGVGTQALVVFTFGL